jgi:hypothetical protein
VLALDLNSLKPKYATDFARNAYFMLRMSLKSCETNLARDMTKIMESQDPLAVIFLIKNIRIKIKRKGPRELLINENASKTDECLIRFLTFLH